jgi:hypothetical protein
VICPGCRIDDHFLCPERTRQQKPGLTALERSASSLCDCAHEKRAGSPLAGTRVVILPEPIR